MVVPERRMAPRTLSTSRGEPVGRLLGTDAAAAEELFNSCYPRLAGWVRRLVDDDDTAHEIASEAFTRLLSRWASLDNPQSYLYMMGQTQKFPRRWYSGWWISTWRDMPMSIVPWEPTSSCASRPAGCTRN